MLCQYKGYQSSSAIAKLRDLPLQASVSIGNKKEALFLLAHLIGDLHQQLRVGAIYLDASGAALEFPNGSTPSDHNATRGGNSLIDWGHNFRTDGCDNIPNDLGDMLLRAKRVPVTQGLIDGFAAKWATETLLLVRAVFKGATPTDDSNTP